MGAWKRTAAGDGSKRAEQGLGKKPTCWPNGYHRMTPGLLTLEIEQMAVRVTEKWGKTWSFKCLVKVQVQGPSVG